MLPPNDVRREEPGPRVSYPSGDEGDDDVGGVLVEVRSPVVVADGGPWVGVSGGDLHVSEGDAGFEGRHDERTPEHVGADGAEPGTPGDGPHPAVHGPAVEALSVCS